MAQVRTPGAKGGDKRPAQILVTVPAPEAGPGRTRMGTDIGPYPCDCSSMAPALTRIGFNPDTYSIYDGYLRAFQAERA
jgi:hypothetical protein